jgi:dienelactone hydrolase
LPKAIRDIAWKAQVRLSARYCRRVQRRSSNAVTAGDRAGDVLVAAALLATRPDVRPDRIAAIGFSHGGGTAVYVARDHMELRPLRTQLAARGGRLVASIGVYPGCAARTAIRLLCRCSR